MLDRAITQVAPQWGLKRARARALLPLLEGNGGYGNHGASRSATWAKDFDAASGDATRNIVTSLHTLRIRSRDLDAGGGIPRAALRTVRTNVVGGGLTVRPRVDTDLLKWSDDQAVQWQRRALREFELWAESKFCDAYRAMNFYEIQQLAQLSWMASGDVFALLPLKEAPGTPYRLCVKLLEADRICTPPGVLDALGGLSAGAVPGVGPTVGVDPVSGHRIVDGVEIDADGAVVAYHVASANPAGYRGDPPVWIRVPAYGPVSGRLNVLHLMEAERPEQYRGVPLVAPVLEQLKQLSRYDSAELINAVVSGMFTAFVQSDRENALQEMFGEDEDAPGEYRLGNGSIVRLAPGESMNFANPNRPNTAFDAFVRSFCTQIGAALEIPRDVLLKDFGNNYSASRGALLEFWKMVRMRREWLAWDFCQPIYEEFLAEAVALGRLKAPGFFTDPLLRRAYAGAEWHGPTTGQLDPLKEVNAAEKRLNLRISTLEREAAEINGSDWAENIRQREQELRMMQAEPTVGGKRKEGTNGGTQANPV